MRSSKYSAPILALRYLAINIMVFLILVLGVPLYGAAQLEQKTYLVTIRIGASLPNIAGNQQPPYDPQILPAEPKEKGIPVGSNVTWINEDESYHTVTSGDALTGPNRIFDSGILSPKVKWSYIFNEAGEYNYYCTVHPFMRGLVRVTA